MKNSSDEFQSKTSSNKKAEEFVLDHVPEITVGAVAIGLGVVAAWRMRNGGFRFGQQGIQFWRRQSVATEVSQIKTKGNVQSTAEGKGAIARVARVETEGNVITHAREVSGRSARRPQ